MSSIEDHYISNRIADLKSYGMTLTGIVAGHGYNNLESGGRILLLQQAVTSRSDIWDTRILILNDRAQVIDDSNRHTMSSEVGNTLINREILLALNFEDTYYLRRDDAVLHIALTVIDDFDGRVGVVLLVASVYDIFQSLDDIQATLILYSLLVGLVVIVLIAVTSHRLISPLRHILRVVERTTTGQLNLRIPITSKDEYATLAYAFNNMTEKLEQVEKTREEFVSNVSHELKTPLSSIKVLSESILLQEHVPEATYREFLQDINNEVDRMTDINNDLLALVKIGQREEGMNIRRTDINNLVEDILKRLAPLADKKKVVLIYEEVRPVQMDADEIMLSLAVSNIVENGIKYTPRGGTVKVIVDSDHQYASITIIDTGVGIPESEHDKIFNRFYRVDKTRDRETGGTGLGLSISRGAVLLHNGSIRISSPPNEGATFIVRLPLRR